MQFIELSFETWNHENNIYDQKPLFQPKENKIIACKNASDLKRRPVKNRPKNMGIFFEIEPF
jgi:hypothetical protein